jgi:uncharacterized protein involved in outer membrane biogenesis
MRWFKRIVIGTLSVIFVLVALALIVPFLIPTSTYKDQIETRVKAATGRDFRINGDLKFSILPSLELSARDIAFSNRPGAAQKEMIKLKGLDLKLKLGPLLSGRFEIVALELVEPQIVLEVDKDGKANWQFDTAVGTPAAAPPATTTPAAPKPAEAAPKPQSAPKPASGPSDIMESLRIETLRIVRGNVIFADVRSGARYEIGKVNVQISLPGEERPFRFEGDTEYKGKLIRYRSEVKALAEVVKGQSSPLTFDVGSDLGKIALSGTLHAAPEPRFAGALKVDIPSVKALLAWLGSAMPEADALGPILLTANIAGSQKGVALSEIDTKLFKGTANGSIAVTTPGGKIALAANVTLKGLDGHALLVAVGATDRIAGTLNATANLTGTGADAKSIQNTLNGTAAFQFANGALRGYNLAGMFRAIGDLKNPLEAIQHVKKAVDALNKHDPNQKTDFSELSASFRAVNGVFTTNDLRMSAPLIRVEGRGSISLPASALDMGLLVKAVGTLEGQGGQFTKLGIPIPLRVRGPFSNVSYGLDEKALGEEIRKKAPDLIKDQILQKPGDLIKKPGGLLDQFRR